MATTADFRTGLVLEIDGQLFQIVYFQHVKPGKGGAFVRSKLKNIRTGAVLDRTWTAGERVNEVRLERRPVQYSYHDGHLYHFMDMETYSQLAMSAGEVGDAAKFLTDGMVAILPMYRGTPISVELPASVELAVTRAEPGVKGDRVSGATKPVTVSTGLVVQAPLFVEVGDTIKVDTRSGDYITRV